MGKSGSKINRNGTSENKAKESQTGGDINNEDAAKGSTAQRNEKLPILVKPTSNSPNSARVDPQQEKETDKCIQTKETSITSKDYIYHMFQISKSEADESVTCVNNNSQNVDKNNMQDNLSSSTSEHKEKSKKNKKQKGKKKPNPTSEQGEQSKKKKEKEKGKNKKKNKKDDSSDKCSENNAEADCQNDENENLQNIPPSENKAMESDTCVDKNSQKADEDNLQTVTPSEKQLQKQLKKKEDELKRAREEAENYRQRLSKLAGAKMTEGNPDIADLSDPNRPTKLAEKYKELYDNEWTNAYEILTSNKCRYDGKGAIVLLRKIVVECYEQCMKHSKEQWKRLATVLSQRITDNADETLKEIGFQETEFKDLKTYRRMAAEMSSENIVKKVKAALIGSLDGAPLQELETYIDVCTRLSWKMALQDPPLHMLWKLKQDDPPNNMFQTYTQSGTQVSYVVWPCLLRQEGGDLLAKGVYQLYI